MLELVISDVQSVIDPSQNWLQARVFTKKSTDPLNFIFIVILIERLGL